MLLQEGDIIELKENHEIYADIPKHFVYSNCRGDYSLTHSKIKLSDNNFIYLRGKYIVYKVAKDGGGTGHGPHDIYPDGHHVYCQKVDDDSVKVDFYQNGSFTAIIGEHDIKPIGRAKLISRWEIIELGRQNNVFGSTKKRNSR